MKCWPGLVRSACVVGILLSVMWDPALAGLSGVWDPASAGLQSAASIQEAAPVIVVETSKGTFSVATFPKEAPLTVAHIVELVKSGFYDGQRVHRAIPGFIVQLGDPQSKDVSKRPLWGRGSAASSGKPIGVAEISSKRNHSRGAVGIAHMGNPALGDSQMYVTLAQRKDLDGQYAVFGELVDGFEVPGQLDVGDLIVKVSIRP